MSIEKSEKDIKKSNQKKDIGERVGGLINKILREPNDDFGDRINYVINKTLDGIPKDISKKPEQQKEIFAKICNFLNKLFKDVDIKKFYNTMPSINIKQYAKKDLGNEFINNIYGKQWKLFYRNQVKGGSCHHRTIFFKKLFEELESRGFDIKSRILVYTLDSGHSAVILNFLEEKYFIDLYGVNDQFKMVINSFDWLNKEMKTNVFSKYSFNKKIDKGLIYYDDISNFTQYMENKKNKYATIEFKPRLENGEEINIRIEIAEEYISLITNGKIKKYKINKMKIPEYLKNSPEIIDFIIKNISCEKENKCEIAKYIKMIRSKIDPEKIYDIFNQE